jgi:uncharacterized protein (DUF488 family)
MTSGVESISGEDMPTLYTLGYGGRHPQHFVSLLTQANIDLVCDVRAEPRRAYRGSYTFNPEKGSGPLPRLLAQAGIAYEWFPELGNPDRQDPEIRAFEQLMAQEAAYRLQRLQTCVQARRACLLCAEQDAQRCHRRIIVAYLIASGYDVQHL